MPYPINTFFRCIFCNSVFSGSTFIWSCPRCGNPVVIEYERLFFKPDPKKPGIWRYSSLLPSFSSEFSLGEGLTPIRKIGDALIKDEHVNPTGSYADRASAAIAAYLMSGGGGVGGKAFVVQYVEDFTKSVVHYIESAIGAKDIFVQVPSISAISVDDLVYFASKSIGLVKDLPREVGDRSAVSYIGYINPLTIEGLKTIVFEIYESSAKVENIVVPAETGLLAYSMLKGIHDLEKSGAEASYNVVAVLIDSQNIPPLLQINPEIKTVKISDEEAYEALKTLTQRGIKAKPISAISYYIAENLGSSIAVLSGGLKQGIGGRRQSLLRSAILETLVRKPLITAYEIWRENREYTLRGVYKALQSMERSGEVCYEISSRGRRKVKLYKLCQPH